MTATRILVQGRVQGVGFRHWLAGRATALGVSGWVRNLRDGRVEALACGDDAAVAALVRACEVGPPLARVDRVEAAPADADSTPGFRTVPTP